MDILDLLAIPVIFWALWGGLLFALFAWLFMKTRQSKTGGLPLGLSRFKNKVTVQAAVVVDKDGDWYVYGGHDLTDDEMWDTIAPLVGYNEQRYLVSFVIGIPEPAMINDVAVQES